MLKTFRKNGFHIAQFSIFPDPSSPSFLQAIFEKRKDIEEYEEFSKLTPEKLPRPSHPPAHGRAYLPGNVYREGGGPYLCCPRSPHFFLEYIIPSIYPGNPSPPPPPLPDAPPPPFPLPRPPEESCCGGEAKQTKPAGICGEEIGFIE